MKVQLLFIFFLISISSYSESLSDKNRIDIANEKYLYGHYNECIQILNKYTSKSYFSKNPVQASDAFFLSAASYFRLADYNSYDNSITDWLALFNSTPDSIKTICQFKLSQLYLEVGNLKDCESILNSIPGNINDRFKLDVFLVKAKLILNQGNVYETKKLIGSQIVKRKNNSVKQIKYDSNLVLLNSEKKIYSDIAIQRIKSAIMQGDLDSAKLHIAHHRTWLDINFPSNYYYRELDMLLGDIEASRSNTFQAYFFYKSAYQYSGFAEGDYKGIEVLSSVIKFSNQLGYIDQSQKLLRRLQMLANVSSGKQEPFQYVYERTLIQLEIEKNNFSEADNRLMKFYSNYKILQAWHPIKLSFAKLESDLLLYKSGSNISEGLDSLIFSYENILGKGHEYIAKLLIEKIFYDIHFGETVNNIDDDLKKLYDSFILKGYGGDYLLSYYELSSTYYLLTDAPGLFRDYAEKAYTYSKKLYGLSSEKRIYYQAVYLKSLIYAGNYKEFYSQFNQLKKTFSSMRWTDLEEKRKSYMAISDLHDIVGDRDDSKNEFVKLVYELDESEREDIYAKSATESQLAFIYYQTGNLFKAEKLIKKSFDSKKRLFLDSSVAYIEDLFFVATLELQKGNFVETEKNLELSSGIISNAYGQNSRLYADYLKLHADYCISIGDYKRGDEYISKSQKIIEGKYGKEDLMNVSLLVRKAYILSQNDLSKIDQKYILSLYNKSLSILSNSIGKENFLYMDVLKKNANFLIKINQLNRADSVLTIVENYYKKKLGNDKKELLEVYLLKGDILYEKGNYSVANSYYGDVKNIASSIYDTKNIYYTKAYARQAKVAYMQNKPGEALSIMENLLPQYLSFVSKNFPALSFREKSKYWINMKDEFEFYTFLVLSNKELIDKYSKNVFDNVIATKAILLSNNIKIRENIMASKDSVLINAYNNWIDLKEYFTSASSLTKAELDEQKIDLKALEVELEKKEKSLSNKSELFKAEDKISGASLKEIAEVLSDKEYAVEIVRYRNFYKHFTDTINYAALIINKNSHSPEVVVFPNGHQFETKALKQTRNAARYHLKDKFSYYSFWAPIQNKISEGVTVYLSCEGVFNQFNLEMLTDSSGKYILDKIELVQVTNTKELLRSIYNVSKQKQSDGFAEVVLGGSPDFYAGDHSQYEVKLNDLPGATKEVEDLAKLLSTHNSKVSKVMGGDLTEDWVKDLDNPKVFHIATHGFYSEVKHTEDDNNAMLNSGLLLAGAGDIIGLESHVNSQDGILTAYEAMSLKLDKTDFVVLSACETGLGEVQAGEGIYGLQRSFLIAGSKAIIISLYKVNDEVTQKLMMEFYAGWAKNGDIRKSFIAAKQKIKAEYPDIPVYWGAFILIEGQPQLKKNLTRKVAGM